MKLLNVSRSLVDVFWGTDGWEPHTRVRLVKNADKSTSLVHVSGTRMPPRIRHATMKALDL